jgi:hypothetical protein
VPSVIPFAAEFGEWIGEVVREIFIDHHHIQEYGFPALVVAVVLGTIFWAAK